jgi:dienelactone hydrolase
VISQHGGGGYPELAAFRGGANYHDMVRGPVAQGYIVFAPLILLYPYGDRDHSTPIPRDVRQAVGNELLWRGPSLGGVEAAKISRALDALLERKEVDRRRTAMIGLSAGGAHTVLTTALDPRVKVAVVSGSPGGERAPALPPTGSVPVRRQR